MTYELINLFFPQGYLCRVAAINAAGEVGPATPDAVSLTLPLLDKAVLESDFRAGLVDRIA